MSETSSIAHKSNAARAKNRPTGTRRLKGSGAPHLVPMAIRVEPTQRANLDKLSKGLMMHKADIIRKGLELAIEWGEERLKRLGK